MIKVPNIESRHSIKIQIRFEDIDLAKHVNNGVYQSYYDLAKSHFFNQIFKGCIDWEETGLVLAHIEIDYHQPIYIHENIVVESFITEIGSKSFEIIQIVRLEDSEGSEGIKSVSRSVMVAFNYQKAHSFEIPKIWRQKLENYSIVI